MKSGAEGALAFPEFGVFEKRIEGEIDSIILSAMHPQI